MLQDSFSTKNSPILSSFESKILSQRFVIEVFHFMSAIFWDILLCQCFHFYLSKTTNNRKLYSINHQTLTTVRAQLAKLKIR